MEDYNPILVAHLTGKVIMLKTLGCALLQLAHSGGLLQLLGENLMQLHPAPLDDLPLDFRRGFFMSDQQDALELTLAHLVQLLQEDAALEELLVTLYIEVCYHPKKVFVISAFIIYSPGESSRYLCVAFVNIFFYVLLSEKI